MRGVGSSCFFGAAIFVHAQQLWNEDMRTGVLVTRVRLPRLYVSRHGADRAHMFACGQPCGMEAALGAKPKAPQRGRMKAEL